jgi:hypothetical protein
MYFFLLIDDESELKGSHGAAVKLLPCDHEVMDSSLRNSLAEMQREVVYIGP